jgi:hypothetical protein
MIDITPASKPASAKNPHSASAGFGLLTGSENRKQRRAAAAVARRRRRAPPQHDGPLPLLATTARTAHELSCSIRHVYELVEQGELDLVHVGPRASRITRESILRVAAKRGAPQPIKHLVKDK